MSEAEDEVSHDLRIQISKFIDFFSSPLGELKLTDVDGDDEDRTGDNNKTV